MNNAHRRVEDSYKLITNPEYVNRILYHVNRIMTLYLKNICTYLFNYSKTHTHTHISIYIYICECVLNTKMWTQTNFDPNKFLTKYILNQQNFEPNKFAPPMYDPKKCWPQQILANKYFDPPQILTNEHFWPNLIRVHWLSWKMMTLHLAHSCTELSMLHALARTDKTQRVSGVLDN